MKKRKIDILNVIGVLLLLFGVTLASYDYLTRYFQRMALQQELSEFLNAPSITEETDFDKPTEGTDASRWGTIRIDKLSVNHIIAKTKDWSLLNRYVVAWESSPNPPENGNFAIAGHNGNCASCVFRDFDKLEIGDEVVLTRNQVSYTYKITSNTIVEATDTSVLDHTPDQATITLVTCKDQITNDPYRRIVKGELISQKASS